MTAAPAPTPDGVHPSERTTAAVDLTAAYASGVLTDATAPAGEPLGASRAWVSEGGHLRVGPDTLSEAGGAVLQGSRENGVPSVVSRVSL